MNNTKYTELLTLSSHYLAKEYPLITNLSNASALLNNYIDNINWVGFYLNDKDKLILGPFQGNPACTIIPNYRGVCGHVAKTKEPIIVDNVHNFEGHIACDGASLSEIVLPIIKDGNFIGVLDIDAPILNRFNNDDLVNLTKFVDLLIEVI